MLQISYVQFSSLLRSLKDHFLSGFPRTIIECSLVPFHMKFHNSSVWNFPKELENSLKIGSSLIYWTLRIIHMGIIVGMEMVQHKFRHYVILPSRIVSKHYLTSDASIKDVETFGRKYFGRYAALAQMYLFHYARTFLSTKKITRE